MTSAERIAELEAQVATLNQVAQENFGSAVDWREQAEALEAKLTRYDSVTGLPEEPPRKSAQGWALECPWWYTDKLRDYAVAMKVEIDGCHVLIDKADLGPSRGVSLDGGKTWTPHTLQYRLGIILETNAEACNALDRTEKAEAERAALQSEVDSNYQRIREVCDEAIIRSAERVAKADTKTVSALCQLADAVLLNGRILAERDAAKDALATAQAENRQLQLSWAGCSQQLKDAIDDLQRTEAVLATATQDERNRCEKAIDDAGGDNTQYHINAIRAPTDEEAK